MCPSGTLSHQLGASAFASFPGEPSAAVATLQGQPAGIKLALLEESRANSRGKQAGERHDKELALATQARSSSLVVAASERSTFMRDMQSCDWGALLHICPLIVCSCTALHGVHAGTVGVAKLAEEWQERHLALPAPAQRQPPPKESGCFKEGTCMCQRQHRQHRLFMKAALSALKACFATEDRAHSLNDGEVIIAWIGEPSSQEESATRELLWTHVPLHYHNPYRPTLLLLQPVQAEVLLQCQGEGFQMSPTDIARSGQQGCPLNFEVVCEDQGSAWDQPAFRTFRDFVLSLSLSKKWSMRFLVLSQSHRPCLLRAGAVCAEVLDAEPTCIWHGPHNGPEHAAASQLSGVLDILGRDSFQGRHSEVAMRSAASQGGSDVDSNSDHAEAQEETWVMKQRLAQSSES